MKQSLIIGSIFFMIFSLWFIADKNDYFRDRYRNITPQQKAIFTWNKNSTSENIIERFERHFGDSAYMFPRTSVSRVKLYKNKAIIGTLKSKTLKGEHIEDVLTVFNNPSNFDWGETTWTTSEAEYIFKFFDKEDNVVGKVYVCLNDCGMVESTPFTPNMKFGQISDNGKKQINSLIQNDYWWKN